MLIKLYSVASAIDDKTNIVYAMYQDGRTDKDSATHIDDMGKAWIDSLSNYDKKILFHYCKNLNLKP